MLITLTPVFNWYLFYWPRKDERQSQPRWNLNSECSNRRKTTKHFIQYTNDSASSLPLIMPSNFTTRAVNLVGEGMSQLYWPSVWMSYHQRIRFNPHLPHLKLEWLGKSPGMVGYQDKHANAPKICPPWNSSFA